MTTTVTTTTDPSQLPPALHISSIVYGRENNGQRVTYLVDPSGGGSRRKIAEGVVLHRWRARKAEGQRFSGCRMPPSIWRGLPVVLGDDVSAWPTLTEAEIAERKKKAAPKLKALKLAVPDPKGIVALIACCGVELLQALVDRHAKPARRKSPGVPDLFLYAWTRTGRLVQRRFVEVKKPDERLLPSQEEELAFLEKRGQKARELRLIEM